VDFDFSPDQIAFRDQVEAFLDANDDPIVFDVTRENMAQVADIPERRALMGKVAEQGWLGITWPKEWGGQEGDGVYEYLLNEALARRGGPQIGKGIGIIGKTILRHGSDAM
jgi:alkylation response protein AidB-like acyl-CoA dehydrogenase